MDDRPAASTRACMLNVWRFRLYALVVNKITKDWKSKLRTFQIKSQKLLLTMYKPYSISYLGIFFNSSCFYIDFKNYRLFYVRTVYYIFLCKTRARPFFWHPEYHGINKYDDSDFHRSLINLTKCFLDFVFRYRYRYLKLLYTAYSLQAFLMIFVPSPIQLIFAVTSLG